MFGHRQRVYFGGSIICEEPSCAELAASVSVDEGKRNTQECFLSHAEQKILIENFFLGRELTTREA